MKNLEMFLLFRNIFLLYFKSSFKFLYHFLNLDPFDEDEAEQRFLTSKPTCFLVVGKPGSGKSTIAKKLASEWKAELVNPTDLILTNIKNNSDLGKKAQDILLKGEAIPESIVAHMIDEKINSPEVAHHGYVLDGFPSQSENNFDIGQQMEMMKNWKLQPDFIINLRIPDKDLTDRKKLSGKFKWRRSKCAFYCPVSLKDGKIVSGKPD